MDGIGLMKNAQKAIFLQEINLSIAFNALENTEKAEVISTMISLKSGEQKTKRF